MKIFIKFAIGLVVIGVLLLIYLVSINNKLAKKLTNELQSTKNKIEIDSICDYNDLCNEFLTNGLAFPKSLEIECQNGDIVKSEFLLSKGNNIILYLEQTYCSSCWGSILNKISQEYPDITKDRLIVFCAFQNFREIVIYFKEMGISSKLVNIINNHFDLPICASSSPFFAIINKDSKFENCCLIRPNKMNKIDAFMQTFIKKCGL